jgi:opacity protein-like surface antigen
MKKKRLILSTMLLSAALTASAADYAYLNIVKSDGTGISLSATEATLTFSEGYLVAGNERILLSELKKMQFSNDPIGTTAISSLETNDGFSLNDADAIYDLKGRQITGTLNKGMYIIKKGNTTKKIIIR